MLHTEYSCCALKPVFKFMITIKTIKAYIYILLLLVYVACTHHSLLHTWYHILDTYVQSLDI